MAEEAKTETKEVKTTSTLSAREKDERLWAVIAHISGFSGFLVPFANIVAPLIIWSVKKHDSAFVDDHAKEALNFQISITIYTIASIILMLLLIGFLLIVALLILEIIVIIMAVVSTNNGEKFRYPLTIRFVK